MVRLREIMSKEVETTSPNESVERAYGRMRDQDIHHLVVVDRGEVVGVVSERDLGGRRGFAFRRNQSVSDVMTPHTVTAAPDATIRQAANLMRGRTIGCLPVLDDGKLVGIVTVTDLLELLGRGVERPTPRGKRWMLRTEPQRVRRDAFQRARTR